MSNGDPSIESAEFVANEEVYTDSYDLKKNKVLRFLGVTALNVKIFFEK
jgi:hypothetical protein